MFLYFISVTDLGELLLWCQKRNREKKSAVPYILKSYANINVCREQLIFFRDFKFGPLVKVVHNNYEDTKFITKPQALPYKWMLFFKS